MKLKESAFEKFKLWFWLGCKEKTSWEWMELFLAPLIIAITGTGIAFSLSFFQSQYQNNLAEKRKEQENELAENRIAQENRLADEKYREETLKKYFDDMTSLFVDHPDLLKQRNPEDVTWDIAQSRTLITLRQLDGTRKGLLLGFLEEAKLVSPIPNLDETSQKTGEQLQQAVLIKLDGADLKKAELPNLQLANIDLSDTNLTQARLQGADLSGAQLDGATLTGINLQRVNLQRSQLQEAKMGAANLKEANLIGADLTGADLTGANLTEANLTEAVITREQLVTAKLCKTIVSQELELNLDQNCGEPETMTVESQKQ